MGGASVSWFHSHVEHVQGSEGGVVEPGADLDVVEELGTHGEEVTEERPQRSPCGLTRDAPHTHVDSSLQQTQCLV